MKVNGVALDLHELQADVKAGMTRGVKQVNTRGTKAARTYVGFWGLATDEIKGLFSDGKQLLEEAEGRGEDMEAALMTRINRFKQRVTAGLRKVRARLNREVTSVKADVDEVTDSAEEQMEQQIEKILGNLGIPNRDQLERLQGEIEQLNNKLEKALVKSKQATPTA
jgi:polyhydroxyalkanoate synthesis regulator phasin